MRSPQDSILPASDRLRILPLDVTDAESIAHAVADAGAIDVLVNNAGVGSMMPLEGLPMEKTRELFETNALGVIAMTQAVLPQMRERRDGVIVNVTSSVTMRPLQFLSAYTASKAAVNGFTESLAIELKPFGIRARIVLPGAAPSTQFGANAQARMGSDMPHAYASQAKEVFARFKERTEFTEAKDVATAVWRAATESDCPMRLPAGADAQQWANER